MNHLKNPVLRDNFHIVPGAFRKIMNLFFSLLPPHCMETTSKAYCQLFLHVASTLHEDEEQSSSSFSYSLHTTQSLLSPFYPVASTLHGDDKQSLLSFFFLLFPHFTKTTSKVHCFFFLVASTLHGAHCFLFFLFLALPKR